MHHHDASAGGLGGHGSLGPAGPHAEPAARHGTLGPAGPHAEPAARHGTLGPADPDLAGMLAAATGPGGEFRHRQHINLAFLAVRRYGMPEATGKVCSWIRGIAAYQRAPQKYHHTVSRAWVELVAHHVAADPECADFETFARQNPALLDKRLLIRHYRSSTLAAASARHGWVEPDLAAFPWSE